MNAVSRPTQMVSGVLSILSSSVSMVAIGFALLLIEPLFVVFAFGAYLPLWALTARASRLGYEFSLAQTERDRRREYLAVLLSRREEAAEIRAFGLARFLRGRHDALYEERISDLRAVSTRRLELGAIGGLVSSLLLAASIAVLIQFLISGRLGLADAGAAAAGIVFLAQRMSLLAGGANTIYESSLFIEDFTSFVEAVPAIEAKRGTSTPPGDFDEIEVERVSFTYPSRSSPSLSDIDLQVHKGEVIALVGANGSGKTTLAKLLAGLYEPSAGAVRWDGVDIAGYDPDLLQRQVAVIFQDYVKYMLTARENIALGATDVAPTDEAIERAASKASADRFLSSLRDGYDTQLGSQYWGGSELSIGQWQRVALARAFYRDAPLLILDEPTASVDARTEADLFERIRELYRGRTVVLISHRFSTVRSADRIVVLDGGRIIEQGSHDALMAAGGLYAELFTLQAAAYLTDPGSSEA
jgi:ATP-binding cassette subfamily B protein